MAGDYRGRLLVAPKGHSTRPTADRARQALFNVLEHAAWSRGFQGARVLDLFAGSGALGLEALSRGAAFCLFVDTDRAARAAIAANLDALGCQDRAGIQILDAADFAPRVGGAPFDFAFLDPPYGQGLAERALSGLAAGGWLRAGAIVSVERGDGEGPLAASGLTVLDERTWGAAQVAFLRG